MHYSIHRQKKCNNKRGNVARKKNSVESRRKTIRGGNCELYDAVMIGIVMCNRRNSGIES